MNKIFMFPILIFLLAGCVANTVSTISTAKIDPQLNLEAKINHLPGGVGNQPAYTIYEGSKWDCNYKTENNDYVCCSREPFSSASPWKYCLLVDQNYNAFAYFELGMNSYRNWPEGKQPIFQGAKK